MNASIRRPNCFVKPLSKLFLENCILKISKMFMRINKTSEVLVLAIISEPTNKMF